MTTTRHKAVQIEMLAESECATEECEHESECPTFLASVCLYCNAEQQGTEDMSLWEGRAARCPLYGTGVPVNTDPCPEWQCPDLSSEDRREGRTCPEHPCTCSTDPSSANTGAMASP